jgi:hypothetical protein
MLGILTDFEYTVNDTGGFDCSTSLVASGVMMLNQKKSKNIVDKFAELPALIKTEDDTKKVGVMDAIKNWYDVFNTGTHVYKGGFGDEYKAGTKSVSIVNDIEIAELAPYVTFGDYMNNLHRECLMQILLNREYVFDKDIPGMSPQIMVTTKVDGYQVWTVDRNEINQELGQDEGYLFESTIDKNMANMIRSKIEKSMGGGTVMNTKTEDESGNSIDSFMVGRMVPVSDPNETGEGEILNRFVASVPYDLDPEYSSEVPQAEKLKTAVGVYCTWGWFEDNVLSRFYGDIQENSQGKLPVSFTEFRSIERLTNDIGEDVTWTDTREDDSVIKPVSIPTKMYNSTYLITTDTSKWIIPNLSDPIASNLNFEYDWAKAEGDISSTNRKISADGGSLLSDSWGKSKLHEGRNWLKHYFDTENFKIRNANSVTMKNVAQMSKSNKDEMCIRNILFNTEFLKKHFKSAEEILKGVQGLWNEFAKEYGDVYKFIIDYDEEGNKVKVREEGFTDIPMDQLLEHDEKVSQGETGDGLPPLFVFPTWEDGSVVKSQNVNAKLPTRMQKQAMYNNSATKYGDGIMNSSYSDISAKAWGKISSGIIEDDEHPSAEQVKQDRYADLMSGKIDYPSRGNRGFGSKTADIQSPLHVGSLPDWDNDKKRYITPFITPEAGRGTQISSTIRQAIDPKVKEYAQQRTNEMKSNDRKYSSNADDAALESFMLTSALSRVNAVGTKFMDKGWNKPFKPGQNDERGVFLSGMHNWSMFYSFKVNNTLEVNQARIWTSYHDKHIDWDGDGIPETTIPDAHGKTNEAGLDKVPAGQFQLKQELMATLHQLLRGDPEFGVLPKQAPLLPLELELEIDGTGGIFPGNSFHSSYLPQRYRDETVFQCMGASHKIDSSGWSTTLTGQIRYLPENSPKRELLKPKTPAQKINNTTPPPQRPKISVPSDDEGMLGDEIIVDIEFEDFSSFVGPPEPKKWIELLSTFKGEVWQNMVIYGHKKTTNSEGQNQWVQTGMHKPEWQPMWEYSDGTRHPFKSAQILQTLANGQQGFRKEYGDIVISISSKTVRQQYWDANIEAPNESGVTVGYDMLHADTLSTIY